MKVCPHCKIEKPKSEYYKGRNSDGTSSWCKKCINNKSIEFAKTHKTVIKNRTRKWRKRNPWYNSYDHAKRRCKNEKDDNYKYYGGRGIRFLITIEDVKSLWFRDKAYLLKNPSIDRIDNDGNYTFDNCRFIERKENARRAHLGKPETEKTKLNQSKGIKISKYHTRNKGKVCKVEGCNNPFYGNGFCKKCFRHDRYIRLGA